jgi:hypothetical protein
MLIYIKLGDVFFWFMRTFDLSIYLWFGRIILLGISVFFNNFPVFLIFPRIFWLIVIGFMSISIVQFLWLWLWLCTNFLHIFFFLTSMAFFTLIWSFLCVLNRIKVRLLVYSKKHWFKHETRVNCYAFLLVANKLSVVFLSYFLRRAPMTFLDHF